LHSFALLLDFDAGYEEIYALEKQNAPFNQINFISSYFFKIIINEIFNEASMNFQ